MEKYNFDKDFMNTSLAISIVGESFSYAQSASEDAFSLVERIENAISMYKECSDVYSINAAKVDDIVKVSDFTMECLVAAADIYTKTIGAVDVCMGQFFTNAKKQSSIEYPQRLSIKVDSKNYIVQKLSEGYLDFGAIGKGYAVDKIAELLKKDWSIKNALIDFGASTMLAMGKDENEQDWKILLDGKDVGFSLKSGQSLGASGVRVQGRHIIDPIDAKLPKKEVDIIYAVAENAIYADAFSTAFMILDMEDIDFITDKLGIKCIKI